MRRAHRTLYRGEEFFRPIRARSDHLEDFRGRAVLLHAARAVAGRSRWPRGQWFCQGRAAAAADGIRGRSAKADLDLAGRFGWITPDPEGGRVAGISKDGREIVCLRPLRRASGAPQDEEKNGRM